MSVKSCLAYRDNMRTMKLKISNDVTFFVTFVTSQQKYHSEQRKFQMCSENPPTFARRKQKNI